MKVKDLYSEVARLGFETLLDDSVLFYQCVNRALSQIATVRPTKQSVTLTHTPFKNLAGTVPNIPYKHEYGVDLIFTANKGRAYTFECDGNGEAYIEVQEGSGWNTLDAINLTHGAFARYSGFIKKSSVEANTYNTNPVRIRFASPLYSFTVRNLAIYDELVSEREEDIPAFSSVIKYDFSKLYSDFNGFDTPPVHPSIGDGYINSGYRIESDCLLLPSDTNGTVIVNYKHKPVTVEETTSPNIDETEIDLSVELTPLLPLLVASYVWIEDEPDKAMHYLTLYRERMSEIISLDRDYTPTEIIKNGW